MEDMNEINYFTSFIKEVLYDLKTTGKSEVFSMEQVREVQKYIPVKITYKDDTFIYIQRTGKKKLNYNERHF